MKVAGEYIDLLNVGLIIATCIVAHLFPYHLVIFSYAILGTAHYLTQISWMHDRKYFVSSKILVPILVVLTIALLALPFVHSGATLPALAIVLALGLSLISVIPADGKHNLVFVGVAGAILFTVFAPPVAMFVAILVPTVVHIFIFTACFMLMGAINTGRKSAYAAIIVLFVCAGTFLIPPADIAIPDLPGVMFFRPVANYFQQTLSLSPSSEVQVFGFLSFAYTYHYFNWFSKAEIIHWHRIPRRRIIAIVIIYAVVIAMYAVNYIIGFLLIVFLSQLHIMMEFPLDLRTLGQLGAAIRSGSYSLRLQK